MPRYLSYLLIALLVAFIVVVPIQYGAFERSYLRNFHTVKEGVIYRSGQLSRIGLERVLHDYGIRTIITLRDAYDPGEPPPDFDEEEYCRKHDVAYVRISPRHWWTNAGFRPADESVNTYRQVMDDPSNYPVLIHCFAGIHRTGAFCAIYRMEYQHWTNERAIQELRESGYTNLDDEVDILGYLEAYRPSWQKLAAPSQSTVHPAIPASRHKSGQP
jgi:tyrosine-protein phosphatase SIW14